MRVENPGMRISLIEGRENKRHPLLEKWLNGPVVLASTSGYRRDRLVELGFKPENITMLATSDAQEREDAQARISMVRARGGSGMEGYDVHVPVDVAVGKIYSVLESQTISPEALIVAADTVTHIFYEDSIFNLEAVPTSKPSDQSTAKIRILSTLNRIAYNYIDLRYRLRLQEKFTREHSEKPDEVKQMLLAHYREQFIQGNPETRINVNTGVAVRLPNEREIRTFNVEEHMFPEAVYNLVDEALGEDSNDLTDAEKLELCVKISPQIQEMVDKIIALHPELVTKVSGGIPFHDQAVRKTLGVTFMDSKDGSLTSELKIDDGVFKGLPGEALGMKLKEWALELSKKST